jgi:hypothetical protein|tara:strand:- start:1059 stop:1787 length:729 start_codon:yes stop_codon:yes gene_type:complete
MKVALTFWGTQKYIEFLPNWYESLEDKFLPGIDKEYFAFTDGEIGDAPDNLHLMPIPDYGFPDTFNMTFEEMLKLEDKVDGCDWLVSVDADMNVFEEIKYDEFFDDSKKYIGVHHPCHFMGMGPHDKYPGCYDINPNSNACTKDILDMSIYWQGCLWGGRVPYIFDMMRKIDAWTKDDVDRDVQARYYEESYMNRWFLEHTDETHTLHASFAFPELFEQYCNFPKKIVHLAKDNKSLGNNEW